MNIKSKISICLITALFVSMSTVNAETSDIFETFKSFVSDETSNNYSVEVVLNGKTLDDVVNEKVKDKYKIATSLKDNNSNITGNTTNGNGSTGNSQNNSSGNGNNSGNSNSGNSNSGNSNNSNSQDKNFYFAGTTDFRDLSLSKKDALLNDWSAIRESYSKYDDKGEDNITIIATAYTSAAEENGGWAGMNAIGGKLGPGCVAAPKDIPFQTKIRISGLGVFNVEDRGGAIVRVDKDTIRIDVWMNSYKEAMHFGKRVYKGRIL